MNMKPPSSDWYRQIWSLDIKDMSWVEQTGKQVDFIEQALELTGKERILDLACGYGRHSLELARRGYSVTGVDITPSYIKDAQRSAENENLKAEFYCLDIREVSFHDEFDAVLNLADGAIGYLETDEENYKIFQVITHALKKGGKSLIDICNREHAEVHFPKKHWEIGSNSVSLPAFDYDNTTKRMLYGGFEIRFGEVAKPPASIDAHSSTRLYSYDEVKAMFHGLGVETVKGYGDYDLSTPMDHKHLQLLAVSVKR